MAASERSMSVLTFFRRGADFFPCCSRWTMYDGETLSSTASATEHRKEKINARQA